MCLGYALLNSGRAGEALREFEHAVGSAAPGSAELADARAYESFARVSLGDLDGARSAAAAAQSAPTPTSGRQDATASMTPLALTDEQRTSVAMNSQALAAQLRGDLSLAMQTADTGGLRLKM